MPAKKSPPKTNPEPEYITVKLPKEPPPGVEFFYDKKFKEWNWRATNQTGVKHLLNLVKDLPE